MFELNVTNSTVYMKHMADGCVCVFVSDNMKQALPNLMFYHIFFKENGRKNMT